MDAAADPLDPARLPAGAGPMPDVPGVEVTHEFHELREGRFHVARIGDRSLPALLLVHGFPQHWWCWRGVAQALDGKAHLIVPDLRGAGWSVVPDAPDAYLKRDMAADLLGLLDAIGAERIAVAGHDWGGWISQLMALQAPERVSRLLALSIPSVIPTPRPPLRSALRMYYQLVSSAPGFDRLLRHTGRFATGLRQDVQKTAAFTDADARAFALPYADPQRAKAAQRMYRSFVGGDAVRTIRWASERRFAMPVRFVFSAYDAYIPPEMVRGIERTGADVQGEVQYRTGHFVADEDPAYVAGLIEQWLLPAALPLDG